jgi:hypothetical protein
MDGYVRLYEDRFKVEGDNPTIGLILCSDKGEAVAKYSILSEGKQIFASRYLQFLPSEEELRLEIEKERRLIDARIEESNKMPANREIRRNCNRLVAPIISVTHLPAFRAAPHVKGPWIGVSKHDERDDRYER